MSGAVQIPVWVMWGMMTGPAITVVAVMLFMARFVTKDEMNGKMRQCQHQREAEMTEWRRNRDEVWQKVDEIKDDTTQIKVDIATLMGRRSSK